jgi:hypothetical protein
MALTPTFGARGSVACSLDSLTSATHLASHVRAHCIRVPPSGLCNSDSTARTYSSSHWCTGPFARPILHLPRWSALLNRNRNPRRVLACARGTERWTRCQPPLGIKPLPCYLAPAVTMENLHPFSPPSPVSTAAAFDCSRRRLPTSVVRFQAFCRVVRSCSQA